jgi:GxxExxY protein
MIIYPDESYELLGSCFEVYNRMGCGFLEAVYQECLEIELEHRDIPFVAQQELKLIYRARDLKQRYVPDFVCYGQIIVELKAVSELTDEHKGQVLNYLHATGMKLGLLINFGHYPKLEYKRMVV